MRAHLADHHRESKDACEVIEKLKNDLEEVVGLRQPPDGDERLDSPVITADVTAKDEAQGIHKGCARLPPCPFSGDGCPAAHGAYLFPLPSYTQAVELIPWKEEAQ